MQYPYYLQEKIDDALAIMARAIDEQHPQEVWSGFSGGHDSVVVTHLLSQQSYYTGAFHANTRIGVEATRQYVRDECDYYGLLLREIKTPESYERIVRKIGFPGSAYHRIMYARLKDRCVAQLLRERKQKRSDRILLATGIRNSESRRRMGYSEPVNRIGALVWVNPLLHWEKTDRDEYIALHRIRRNVIADSLGMSGECLCGAYASKGELERIRAVDPEIAAFIDELNRDIVPRLGWSWEEQPPKGHVTPREDLRAVLSKSPLCAACDARHEELEAHSTY